MFQLVPVASVLHPPRDTERMVGEISAKLARHHLDHRIVDRAAPLSQEEPLVLLTVTGGTEHLVMKRAMEWEGPVILAAHPSSNSFPAALEILARLQQVNKRGRIVMLGDREEDYQGLRRLLNAVNAHRALARTRLGVFGEPSDWLIASPADLQKTKDLFTPKLVKIPMSEIISAMDDMGDDQAQEFQRSYVDGTTCVVEPDAADLLKASKVYWATRRVIEEHALDACTMRCFDLVTNLQTTGCLALSSLIDQGIMAGCEGDIPATLTMLFMNLLTGEVPFMANPQEVNRVDNTVWVAHCTIARNLLTGYSLRSHFESSLGVGIQGIVAPQKITLARIGGEDLSQLFVASGEILEHGEDPERCRTQLKLRLDESVDYFLSSPLGNHHVLIRGHWKEELLEYYNLYR